MNDVTYPYPGAVHEDAYEWLNRCTDPARKVERLIATIAPWKGKTVLDIGAGSGFHSVWFAKEARHVIALEPDNRLRHQIFKRLSQRAQEKFSVIAASAENILLPNQAIDIVYARFAYFFGTPDCLPGLREVMRVLKPNGHFFVIDVIPNESEWGAISTKAYPHIFRADYAENQMNFYETLGFSRYEVDTAFVAPNRDVLKQVFMMDFPHIWETLLQEVQALRLSYKIAIFHYGREGAEVMA
ncbi:MAG: class I SAM-dependent methyltransferase [Chloroflexota bacterium]